MRLLPSGVLLVRSSLSMHVGACVPCRQRPPQTGWTIDRDGRTEDVLPIDESDVPSGERHRIEDVHDDVVSESGVEPAQLDGSVLDVEPLPEGALIGVPELEPHDRSLGGQGLGR